MKMKQISAVIIGVLLLSDVSALEGERVIPSLDQVKSIKLSARPTLWEGTFYPDGSATLEWGGSGLLDKAGIPKGRISFEEVYNILAPHLKPKNDRGKVMPVFLRVAGDEPARAWYIHAEENKGLVQTLMFNLRDNVNPDDCGILGWKSFEERLRDYPLVPGGILINHDKKDNNTTQKETPINKDREQVSPPNREAAPPDTSPEETPVTEDEGRATTSSPSRLWLYALIPLGLFAVLWLAYRKRKRGTKS